MSDTCSRCSKPVEALTRAHCRKCQQVYHQTCVPRHASALLPTHEQWWCPACTKTEWQKATENHCAERCAAATATARVVCGRCARRFGWGCAGLSPVAAARLGASPAPWLCRECRECAGDVKDEPSITDAPAVTTPAAILLIPAVGLPTNLPPPLTKQPPSALSLQSTDSLPEASRPLPPLKTQPTPAGDLPTQAANIPTVAVKQPTLAVILLTPTVSLPTPAVDQPTPASKPMPESRQPPTPPANLLTPAANLPTPEVNLTLPGARSSMPASNLPTPPSKPMPAKSKPANISTAAVQQPTPATVLLTPASNLPTPESNLPTPASRKPKPASREPTPGPSEATPASNLPTPSVNLPTPASKPMPASKKPKPASRQSSPEPNLPTPTVNLPTPESKPMPASKKPKPASRQPTSRSSEPTPASSQLSPESKPMPAPKKLKPASSKSAPASKPMPASKKLKPASKPKPASKKRKLASSKSTPESPAECDACPLRTEHRSKLMCEACRRQFWMCSNIEAVKDSLQNGKPWLCSYCVAPRPNKKRAARRPKRKRVKIPRLSASCVRLLGSERGQWLERFAKVYTVKAFSALRTKLRAPNEVYRAMGNALGIPDASVDELKRQEKQFLREYRQLLESLVRPFVREARGAAEARRWALRRAPAWLNEAENEMQALPAVLQALPGHSWAHSEKALDPAKVLTALSQLALLVDMTCPSTAQRLARKYGMTPAGLSDLWAQYVRFCTLKLQSAAATAHCPAHLALSPAEWAACDAEMRRAPDPLPWLVCTSGSRRCPLRTLVSLARRCSLELPTRHLRLQRWARALQLYRHKGMTASLVMLQRRWWEMKREARARFGGCTADEVAATQSRGVVASLRLIAMRYPYVLTEPLPSWTSMVQGGDVVEATEQALMHLTLAPPLPSSDEEEVIYNSMDLKKRQLQAQMSRELKELKDLNNMQNLNIQTHIDEYEAELSVVTDQISNKPYKSKNSQDNTINNEVAWTVVTREISQYKPFKTKISQYKDKSSVKVVVSKQMNYIKPHKSKNSQDKVIDMDNDSVEDGVIKKMNHKNSQENSENFDRDSVEDETDGRMKKSIEELLTIDPKNAEASIIFDSESDSDDDRMVIDEAYDLTDYNQVDLRCTERNLPELTSMVESDSNADPISLEDKSSNIIVSDDCCDANVVRNEFTDTEVMISSNIEVSKQFDSITSVVSDDNTTSVVEDNNTTSLIEDNNTTNLVEDNNISQVENNNTTNLVEDNNTTSLAEDYNTTSLVEVHESLRKCPDQAIIDDRLNPEEDSLCINTDVNNLENICENVTINNVRSLTNSDPKEYTAINTSMDVDDSVSKDITDNVTSEVSETTGNLTNELEMDIENTDISDGKTTAFKESDVNSRDNVHTVNSFTENSSNMNENCTSMETEECIEDDSNIDIASADVNNYESITSENVPEVSKNVDVMGNEDDLSNVLDINSIDVTEDLDELVLKCDEFIDNFDSIDILEVTKCDDFDTIDVSQDELLIKSDDVKEDFNSIDVSQDDLLMKCDEVVDGINSIDVSQNELVPKCDDLNSIDITQDELLTKCDEVSDDFNSIDVKKDELVTKCDGLNSIDVSEDIIEPCVEKLQDNSSVFDNNLKMEDITNTFIPSPSKDNSMEAKKSVLLLGDCDDNDDILAEIAKDYANVRTNVRENCSIALDREIPKEDGDCIALDREIPKEDILVDSDSDDSVEETGSCTVDPKLLLVPMVPLRRVDQTYLWQHHDGSSVDLRQAAEARQRRRAQDAEELAALVAAYRSTGAPITGRLSQLRRLCRPCGVPLQRLGAAQRHCDDLPLQGTLGAGYVRPTRGYIKELRKRLYSAVRDAIGTPAVAKSRRTRTVASVKSSRTSSYASDDYSDSDQEPLSKHRRTGPRTEGGTGLDDWIRERNVNQRFFSLLPASSLTPKIPPIFHCQIPPNCQTTKDKLQEYGDNTSRQPHLHHSYAEHKENIIKTHTTRVHIRQIVATPNTMQTQVASDNSATKPVESHNPNSMYVNPPYKILTLDATRNSSYSNLISLLSTKGNSSIYANNSVSVDSRLNNAGNQSKTEDGDSPTKPLTRETKNMVVNEGNHSSNTEDGDTSTKLVIEDSKNIVVNVGNQSTNTGDTQTKCIIRDQENISVNAGNHTTNTEDGDTPTKPATRDSINMIINEGNLSSKTGDCDTPTKLVGVNMSVNASNLSTIKKDSDSPTKAVTTDPNNTSVNAGNQSTDFDNSSKLNSFHPNFDKSLSMEPQAVNIMHPPKLMTIDSQDLDIKPLNLQTIKTEKIDSAYADKSNQCTQMVDGIKTPWAFPINAGNPHGVIQPGNPHGIIQPGNPHGIIQPGNQHCISQPLKPCKEENVNQPFVLSNQNTNVPIIQTQPQNVVSVGDSGTVMHTTNYYMIYPQNATSIANLNPTMVILPVTVSINPPQIINTVPVKPEVGVMQPQMVAPITPQVYQATSMEYGKPQVAPVMPQMYQTTMEFGGNMMHSKELEGSKHSQINKKKKKKNFPKTTRSVESEKTKTHEEKGPSRTSKSTSTNDDDMPVISNVVSLAGCAEAGEPVVISDDSDSESSPERYVVRMRAPSPLFFGPARRASELLPEALEPPRALLRLDDAPVWTLSTGEIMVTEAAIACRRARYYVVALRGKAPARLTFRREPSSTSEGRNAEKGVDEDGDSDSDAEGSSPELVADKNKLYKRVRDKPALFARVLTGVTDVMLASQLFHQGFALYAYSRRSDSLTPLRALPGRVLSSADRALSGEVARGFNEVQDLVGKLQGYRLKQWSVSDVGPSEPVGDDPQPRGRPRLCDRPISI